MRGDGQAHKVPLTESGRVRVLIKEFGISEEMAVKIPPDEPSTREISSYQRDRWDSRCGWQGRLSGDYGDGGVNKSTHPTKHEVLP